MYPQPYQQGNNQSGRQGVEGSGLGGLFGLAIACAVIAFLCALAVGAVLLLWRLGIALAGCRRGGPAQAFLVRRSDGLPAEGWRYAVAFGTPLAVIGVLCVVGAVAGHNNTSALGPG